jgi:hypothetical protein
MRSRLDIGLTRLPSVSKTMSTISVIGDQEFQKRGG